MILLLSSCLLASCASNDEVLLAKLRKEMLPVLTMTKGYMVLDLNQLTDFPWDSVYAFHGEEGGEYVNSTIGFRWDGPAVPNLHQRLLFVHQGAVVAYVDCNEEEGVYNAQKNWPLPIFLYKCADKAHGIARREAKFATFRACDRGYISYPLIPLKCLANSPDYQALLARGCADLPAQLARNKRLEDSVRQVTKN